MSQILFVLIVVIAVGFTHATLLIPCGGSATIFHVNIEGCEDGVNDICVFIKGNTYEFTIGGISSTSTISLNTTVNVLMTVPLPFYRVDLCEDLSVGECPMEIGEQFVYGHIFFNMTNIYPVTVGKMRIETKSDKMELMLCGEFNFAIRAHPALDHDN